LQLKVQSFLNFRAELWVTFLGALVGEVSEIGIFSPLASICGVFGMLKLFRDVKLGQQNLSSKFVSLAFVNDFLRAVD
jgi:hypothetical protein